MTEYTDDQIREEFSKDGSIWVLVDGMTELPEPKCYGEEGFLVDGRLTKVQLEMLLQLAGGAG